MPEKEGAEEKSTKSVVNKKQKQMMGEEGYDIARDMGRVRPSKDKKDATTMPVSKEMKKTQKVNKGPSALELVKKKYKGQIMDVGKKKANEELDLIQVAESFGGYIIEVEIKRDKSGTVTGVETTPAEKEAAKKAQEKQREIFKKAEAKRAQKDKLKGAEDQIKNIKTGTRPVDKETQKDILKDVDAEQLLDRPRADKSERSRKSYARIMSDSRREAAKERRAQKLKDPKFRASETLRKAKQTDIKGGPSVKRGDPVPQEVKPVKKKPVPEIGGYQFNTFKDSEMKKRKTFKQAFGRPTGADPKTGKPTYVAPGVVTGKPRKSLPRSKNLPDYDTVKTAVDMGLNPDEIDKNKFIDQKVRDTRMKRLGTPDPFDPDYAKKVKKVDQRTKTAKAFKAPKYKVYGPERPTVSTKVKTQTVPTGNDFKRFRKQSDQARRIKVGQDIDKKIAQVAKKNVSKAKIATPVVKTLGKETGEAAVKAAGKRALKRASAKALAKQIPGVGSLVAGGEAAARAAKGDLKGAALSIGQAIPGVSIPLAAVDVAREVRRAKGGARVGQQVATQVSRALPGTGKKVKTATQVVNPTVVGSFADTSAQFRKAMKDPKKMGAAMAVGAVGGKALESGSRSTFKRIQPPAVKGGRTGRRSAKS